MKTLTTAAVLAALTFSPARGDEPAKTKTPAKAEVKKITVADLGRMLEELGHEPRESKDKDGKVIGFHVDQTRDGTKVTCYVTVSDDGTTVWIDNSLLVFNEKTLATVPVLLGLLAEQDDLWPAYVVYYPKTKRLKLARAVEGPELTRQKLRAGLESFMEKWAVVRNAYQKAVKDEAVAKEPIAVKE